MNIAQQIAPQVLQDSVLGFKMKGPDQEHHKVMRWHIIAGFCLINGYRRGAELGVSQGRFTMFLCAVMHNLKMTCVDLWSEQEAKPDVECSETYTGWDHEGNYNKFREVCDKNFPGRVDIRRCDTTSKQALKGIADGSLDFVFIDADHTYEGCKKDILAWAPKVRSGGLIAGHDFNWPPVAKIVKEIYPTAAVLNDNVWLHFKP